MSSEDFEALVQDAMKESDYVEAYDLFTFLSDEMQEEIEEVSRNESGEINTKRAKLVLKACIKTYWEGVYDASRAQDPEDYEKMIEGWRKKHE